MRRTLPGLRVPGPTTLGSSLLLLLAGTALAEEPLTREAFVERVLAQSLDARVAGEEARIAEARRTGAGLWPNPVLEYERQAETGPNPLQDLVSASIPLVLSGRLGLERAAADLSAEAAEARLQRARARLRHEASGAFLKLVEARRHAQVLRASVAELDGLVARAMKREEAGEASGYERMRLELEQASLADRLRGLEATLTRRETEALRLLGPEAKSLPALASDWPALEAPASAEALLASLAEHRGNLRAAALDARAAETSANAAARRVVPDVAVTAGPMIVDQESVGAVVGFALPLPIFDRGRGQAALAEAERTSAELRRERLVHDARVRLSGLLAELTRLQERREKHATDVLARAEALARIARAAFAGGEAGLLALVDAERELREARLLSATLEAELRATDDDLHLLTGAWDR